MKTLLTSLVVLLLLSGGIYFVSKAREQASADTPTSSSSPASVVAEPAVPAAPRQSRTPPADTLEYQSTQYGFVLFYPKAWHMKEFDEGGGAKTVTFENADTGEGMQIFIKRHLGQTISEADFKVDEPSGVMLKPTQTTVGGASATAFYGKNDLMGDTREIWMIHDGYLYEISTYKALEDLLGTLIGTWMFTQ